MLFQTEITMSRIPVVMKPSGILDAAKGYTVPADSEPCPDDIHLFEFIGDSDSHEVPLSGREWLSVGRANSNDIVVDTRLVSSKHAVLQSRKSNLYLLDLGSTNGSFLNGEQVPKRRYVELLDKDKVTFGDPKSQVEFVVVIGGA